MVSRVLYSSLLSALIAHSSDATLYFSPLLNSKTLCHWVCGTVNCIILRFFVGTYITWKCSSSLIWSPTNNEHLIVSDWVCVWASYHMRVQLKSDVIPHKQWTSNCIRLSLCVGLISHESAAQVWHESPQTMTSYTISCSTHKRGFSYVSHCI